MGMASAILRRISVELLLFVPLDHRAPLSQLPVSSGMRFKLNVFSGSNRYLTFSSSILSTRPYFSAIALYPLSWSSNVVYLDSQKTESRVRHVTSTLAFLIVNLSGIKLSSTATFNTLEGTLVSSI